MNIKIEEDYQKIYCHFCEKWIDLGEIVYTCEEVLCLWCGTLLGYKKDLEK